LKDEGVIRASTRWFPAASFVEDTGSKLIEIAARSTPGIYLLDSNQKWNLFEIATALNTQFNFGWKIEPTEDYGWDSRMMDERMQMPSLRERLPLI
jgi:dTDP-4-dehydrorhamnose reductase